MSSGFVSAGTIDQPVQRDEEWLKAQQDIEVARRQKEAEGVQDGGKSLYEVLQNNKAAKQDAFEESIKLKNQFRNLEEDEVDFLDSVLESTRAKEEEVKNETATQLEIFRKQQEEADKAARGADDADGQENAGSPLEEVPSWGVGPRKRKKGTSKEGSTGFKLRKSSTTHDAQRGVDLKGVVEPAKTPLHKDTHLRSTTEEKSPGESPPNIKVSPGKPDNDAPKLNKPSATLDLGLLAYSSDEDG
ncbi:uncharacterized protein KY384_009204 [Bacidia gigantensis]|uniref:uncharacterized protein n=1 Tax=Bacidia gigantensis TaxID=2732470 RepID=UPI001D05467C|nr:uncharacterized protein KY384_009204 [Bacidia gigantensis]KAG8525560.1 hypothetical protein KY384_009204 [Bacidia gigantensis]